MAVAIYDLVKKKWKVKNTRWNNAFLTKKSLDKIILKNYKRRFPMISFGKFPVWC